MENKKVLSMIGLATKAGRTASGEFAAECAIKDKKACLVFIAEDASESSRKTFESKCSFYNIPVVICFNKEELGRATGKEIRAFVAITDKGFADAILKLIDHNINGGC